MMLLEAQPSLFARSLGKVNSTVWDSNSVDDICNGLGFLSYLLNSKILDSKLKASLRAFIAIPNQDSDFSSKSVIEILQSNIICSSMYAALLLCCMR